MTPRAAPSVFAHALAFADAGHDVQVFLTGEATYLMRKTTVDAVKPIGWPPLSEMMEKIVFKPHPRVLLRGLLPGPWDHGSRLGQLGRKVVLGPAGGVMRRVRQGVQRLREADEGCLTVALWDPPGVFAYAAWRK